jgi:hypothetical protein
MKLRYNLIFIPLLIICGFVVWYLGFREKHQVAAKRLSERVLFDPEKLDTIEIIQGDETIRMEKPGGTTGDEPAGEWVMVNPIEAGCNPDKISELIQNIIVIESERDLNGVTESQLAEYGLDNPELRLKLIASSGDVMMDLSIGLENTSGTSRYGMFTDNPNSAFLLPVYQVNPLEISPADIRDMRALVFDKDNIDSVQISSSTAEIGLDKEENGWMVNIPERFPASPARLDLFFDHIQRLEAVEFLPENAGNPELAEKSVEVELASPDNDIYTLTLYGEDISRGIFATSSWQPSPFIVEAYIFDRLALDPSVFINTNLIGFPATQIAKVLVREPGSDNLEIERTGSGPEDWRIINPAGRNFTEEGGFQAFINSLLALQPEYIVPPPAQSGEYGMDPVYYMKIEVTREQDMGTTYIKLGALDENGNYYATQDNSSYFTISSGLVDAFVAAEMKLKASPE